MKGMKAGVAIAGGVILAFLIGFGWQYTRAIGYRGQLDRSEQALTFQHLEATLGAATIEAERGSYEAARQLASDFFTSLQQNIGQASPAATAGLRSILGERDAVITALSRADSQSGNALATLFERYRAALGESMPRPTPPDSAAATTSGN